MQVTTGANQMNEQFTFTKAERKKAKLKLNLSGPSGSGKEGINEKTNCSGIKVWRGRWDGFPD